MKPVGEPRSRRETIAQLGLGLMLAACDPGGARGGALGGAGSFRALRDLSAWRPGWQAAAWEPLPVVAGGGPLATFQAAMAQLAAGRSRQPVLVVQFGDSHTIGPYFVGRLREMLQERFGALGPGRLPPGQAPRYWRPPLAQVQQEGNWSASTALRSAGNGPFGMVGYRLHGEGEGSRITLRSTEQQGFDRFFMDVLVQPGGGSFRLGLDGEMSPPLRASSPVVARAPLPMDLPRRYHEVTLELVGDGPVDLLGWGVERRGPGVLVEGHGINGATIDMLGNLDQRLLAEDLANRPPALIILAYGTNEAVNPDITEDAYAAQLTARVRALRQMAPHSSFLLVGAPDSARRVPRRAPPPPGACHGWAPLPGLAAVKAAQQRVAAAEGCAFWDWAEVTGGICQLHALTQATPRLVQDDHIHLSADGYRASAERLFARLSGALPPQPRV